MQSNSNPKNNPAAKSKISPELKKAFLIASPFVVIFAFVVVFMLTYDDNPNREAITSATQGNNSLFEDIIAPCSYGKVADTLAFLRMQIDSLYTVPASPSQKAQNYDCICKFLPQAKADGRLTIREADGDSRIGLITHLKSSQANCLRIISVDFEPNSTQVANVKIVAEPTNILLYSNEEPKNSSISNQVTVKSNSNFRLPTSFVGNINGSRAQLNLSKLKQEGDEITFRFNLLSPANPQQEQQGTILLSSQIVKLNRVGEGKFEQKGDKMILKLDMETISFESIN